MGSTKGRQTPSNYRTLPKQIITPCTIPWVGWNWRSLNSRKILYINYLIEKINPEIIIICESWLDKKPSGLDKRYDIYQTGFAKHQGVWIMAKKNLVSKWFTSDNNWLLAVQWQINKHTYFVIGAYFKQNSKAAIMEQIKRLLWRIRKTFINPTIILFGDLNPDKQMTIKIIETELKLKCNEINKLITTRTQSRLHEETTSTLNFFMSTTTIESIETLEKYESDHFPLAAKIQTPAGSLKCKNINLTQKKIICKHTVDEILNNPDWPTTTNNLYNRSKLYSKTTIRPTVKIQQRINNILEAKIPFENKQINIRTAWSDGFKSFVKGLDMSRKQDISKFYKIVNSLIKYKEKGKIVKGIREDNKIIYQGEMTKIIVNYFSNLYKCNPKKIEIRYNNIWDFRMNIDRAIDFIATNKAWGIDSIPGEFYKTSEARNEIKNRISTHFELYIHREEIPEYFMQAKLVLISKDGSDHPPIGKIRPISVLPSITKMFELSILHHLEQATLNPKFNRNQRGFIKEKSTIHNINDLFSIWREIQADKRRNRRNSTAIVFFDFEKAYDMVPRQLLIKKLNEFDIPCNIIAIIKDMLDKFCLNYNGIKIKTEKGLVQGSTLSPLLFNLFINDLLNLLERWGIETRAYADDIAWIWKNVQQWQEAIRIMKSWADENAMKINPTKSGILRILLKKSKIKKIQNELDIPEVESYCYLGIRINQTINPMEHILSLRSIEDKLIRRINILKPSLVSIKEVHNFQNHH